MWFIIFFLFNTSARVCVNRCHNRTVIVTGTMFWRPQGTQRQDRRPPGRLPFQDPRRSRELERPWRSRECGRPWWIQGLGRAWRSRELGQPWQIRGLGRPLRSRELGWPWRVGALLSPQQKSLGEVVAWSGKFAEAGSWWCSGSADSRGRCWGVGSGGHSWGAGTWGLSGRADTWGHSSRADTA